MRIMTQEFLALKVAVGIVEDHAEDLTDREKRLLAHALDAIADAELRLEETNRKQAAYMKERRHNLQDAM